MINGDTARITVFIIDGDGVPRTGLLTQVVINIMLNKSGDADDGKEWNGSAWQAPVGGTIAMTELQATAQPGIYYYDLDTGATGLNKADCQLQFHVSVTDDTNQVSWGNVDVEAPGVDLMAAVYEGSETLQDLFRLLRAASAGKLTGAGTTEIKMKSADGSKDRITATVTSNGNRTSVVTDVS